MSHILPELLPMLIHIAFGFPLALSAFMLLTIDLFTELAPAISLAYEPPESDIMSKPPRNPKKDRIANPQLLSYVYLQAGLIESFFGFLGFFLVFDFYGLSFSKLFNTPYFQESDDPPMPTFPGCHSYEHFTSRPVGSVCYTAAEQKEVLWQAQTCYYAMVVMAQVFHVWLCKTRKESIFTHGLFRNEFTFPAVVTELCLLFLFIFPPSSKDVILTIPFPPKFWGLLVLAPFTLFVWQEGRKWWVRKHPNGFVASHVNW